MNQDWYYETGTGWSFSTEEDLPAAAPLDDYETEEEPTLSPECHNEEEVDKDKVWEEIRRSCGGIG